MSGKERTNRGLLFVCPDGETRYRELLDAGLIAQLEHEGHELRWFEPPPDSLEEYVRRVDGADGILLMYELPESVLEACPSVKAVFYAGTGYERFVPEKFAAAHDVVICNVPDYGANAIAEHTLALIFAAARQIPRGDRLIRGGVWHDYEGRELRGSRLGVVGVGPIGFRVAELGRAVGMDVVGWTRSPTPEREELLGGPFVELEELFATSDVVSLHLAHRPGTAGIVSERLLRLMKPSSVLVNTARAELVDNGALVRLLDAGEIFGAAMDVFDPEPPQKSDPLLGCDRVVMTPHVGWYTPGASVELFRGALLNVLAYARGTPANVVVGSNGTRRTS